MTEIDYTSSALIEEKRQALLAFDKDFPFFKLMGIQIISVEPGRSRLGMAWREDLCQPAGIMHGGAIASLVDTAIAHSILLTPAYLEAFDVGRLLVSVDLRIKYLRPVSGGKIHCDAQVTRMGRQIIHTSAVVCNEEGKEVAYGDAIYMMISGRQIQKK